VTATVMEQNFFRTWDLFGYPQQVRCGRSRARSELAQVEDHPLIIVRAAAQTEATGKGRVPLSDPAPTTSTTTRPLSDRTLTERIGRLMDRAVTGGDGQ
jgi:hypothetical protein